MKSFVLVVATTVLLTVCALVVALGLLEHLENETIALSIGCSAAVALAGVSLWISRQLGRDASRRDVVHGAAWLVIVAAVVVSAAVIFLVPVRGETVRLQGGRAMGFVAERIKATRQPTTTTTTGSTSSDAPSASTSTAPSTPTTTGDGSGKARAWPPSGQQPLPPPPLWPWDKDPMTDEDRRTYEELARVTGNPVSKYLGCRFFAHEDGKHRQFLATQEQYPSSIRPLDIDGVLRCPYGGDRLGGSAGAMLRA